MRFFLGILSVLVFLIGLAAWSASTTVIHEIMAGILFIISAIFLSAAAIVDAIVFLRKETLANITDKQDKILKELKFLNNKFEPKKSNDK